MESWKYKSIDILYKDDYSSTICKRWTEQQEIPIIKWKSIWCLAQEKE